MPAMKPRPASPTLPPHQIHLVVVRTLCVSCGVRGPIDETSRLVEDLGLDSITLLTLIVELEDQLRMTLDVDQTNPPATVGELVTMISGDRA